jgi:predicted esterase
MQRLPRRLEVCALIVSIGLLGLLASCRRAEDAPTTGVRFVHVFAHGADTSAPLLVWIHGRGGTPEKFEAWWREFPAPLEIALPQGFAPSGSGWSWFDWPPGVSEEDLVAAVSAAETRLWQGITDTAHGRKVIVAGFSQGAILAYLMAARHPDTVLYAFPIAGLLPTTLLPSGHAPRAPVYAMHGTTDDVIPADYGRATVAAFKKDGAAAELLELPGVGHTLTPEIRAALVTRVRALIERAPDQ